MAEKNSIIYDQEEDILSLSKGKKVKNSVEVGDFIVDIDYKGNVVGLEVLDASNNLGLDSKLLKSLKNAFLNITYKPNYVLIALNIQNKNKEKEVSIPIALNLGHTSVKSEKTIFASV